MPRTAVLRRLCAPCAAFQAQIEAKETPSITTAGYAAAAATGLDPDSVDCPTGRRYFAHIVCKYLVCLRKSPHGPDRARSPPQQSRAVVSEGVFFASIGARNAAAQRRHNRHKSAPHDGHQQYSKDRQFEAPTETTGATNAHHHSRNKMTKITQAVETTAPLTTKTTVWG